MRKLYTIFAATVISAFSFIAKAQNEIVVGDVKVGDLIELSDGSKWYVGTNEVINGNFDADPAKNSNQIVGWHIASNYEQMTTGNFAWHATGGYDGGPYIQAIGHTGAGGNRSIGQRWPLEQNTRYYFSFYVSHNSANNQYIPVITLTDKESTAGGQNEDEFIIGKSGDSADGCLGFANFIDENGDGVGEWAQTACSFESKEYTWLQFNARWLKENKIEAAFDGVFLAKLYDPETTTQSMVAYLALQSKINEVYDMASDLAEYAGIAEELSDFAYEGECNGEVIGDMTADSELENLQAALEAINQKIDEVNSAIAAIQSAEAITEEATYLLEQTEYPGYAAFNKEMETYLSYVSDGYHSLDDGATSTEYVNTAIDNLKKAIVEYRFSQKATDENPANYSFLVKNPEFCTQNGMPTYTDNVPSYPKADEYTAGTAPAEATSDGWLKGSVTTGDQRLNFAQGRICWNLWDNHSGYHEVYQELKDIPNGYYTVSGDMITQSDWINEQHLFAVSATSSVVSPNLTEGTWNDTNDGAWTTLTTDKIAVVDGTLKIGAGSMFPEENQKGWFCLTHVVLNYYGPVSEADMMALFNKRIEDYKAQADTMHLAADKAAFVSAINEAKTIEDLEALNAAKAEADASEAEYSGIMAGTYASLQDSLANANLYSANAKAIVKVPVDYMSKYLKAETATYKETGAITAVLRYYRDTLVPALQNAENKEVKNEMAKEAVKNAINSFVGKLGSYEENTEVLAEYVSELNSILSLADKADIAYGDNTDVTAYLSNPTIDAIDGWIVDKPVGDGNGRKTSQQYDGNGAGGYIDTYNSAGGVRATIYQVLDVPNGTYKVENLMRNAGGGAYLFASTAAPVTVTDENEVENLTLDASATNVLALATPVATANKYVGAETEEESIVYNDTYGELWMAAAENVIAALGISATPSDADGARIYDYAVEQNEGSTECPEKVDATDWAILGANGGKGRGWFNNSLEITVSNHTLVVGVSCDSIFTAPADGEAFTGTWFSADNFKLTLVKAGDNTGWNPVATSIATLEPSDNATISSVYSISGARVAGLQKGLNIVKYSDGQVKKIFIK